MLKLFESSSTFIEDGFSCFSIEMFANTSMPNQIAATHHSILRLCLLTAPQVQFVRDVDTSKVPVSVNWKSLQEA